jgi:hypothetical protein
MASIVATNTGGGDFAPMEAGMYVARCVQMIQIGTVTENIQGKEKTLHKVRFGFEFPTEKKVFKEEKGEQPYFLSKEYTLSMHEKATLRLHLETWRGKKFTEEESKSFDVTRLLKVPCMINVVHKVSEKSGKTFAEIGSISPLMKGMVCPEQINETSLLCYDDFNEQLFESLPDFLKDKIKSSVEYFAMKHGSISQEPISENVAQDSAESELPF